MNTDNIEYLLEYVVDKICDAQKEIEDKHYESASFYIGAVSALVNNYRRKAGFIIRKEE